MASVIKNVSFDAADALALAAFWAAVLGSDVDEDARAGHQARSRGYGYCGARCWKARMSGFSMMPSWISMARRMT